MWHNLKRSALKSHVAFSAICLLKELFESVWLCFSTLLLKSGDIPTNYRPGRAFTNNTLQFWSLCDVPHRHAPLHSHHWRHWWNTWVFSRKNLTHLAALTNGKDHERHVSSCGLSQMSISMTVSLNPWNNPEVTWKKSTSYAIMSKQ